MVLSATGMMMMPQMERGLIHTKQPTIPVLLDSEYPLEVSGKGWMKTTPRVLLGPGMKMIPIIPVVGFLAVICYCRPPAAATAAAGRRAAVAAPATTGAVQSSAAATARGTCSSTAGVPACTANTAGTGFPSAASQNDPTICLFDYLQRSTLPVTVVLGRVQPGFGRGTTRKFF